MKMTLSGVASVLTMTFSIHAHAEAPICPHYEQSELLSMTSDQLVNLMGNYTVTIRDGYGNPTSDDMACSVERDRISTVLNAKLHDEINQVFNTPAAKSAEYRGELFSKTPEGKIYVEMQKMCQDAFDATEASRDLNRAVEAANIIGDEINCDLDMSVWVAHDKNCGTLEDPDPNDPYKNDPKIMACLESYKPKTAELIKTIQACNYNDQCIHDAGQ